MADSSTEDDLVLQQPDGAPQQLVLLLHGAGGSPEGMAPLGQRLAAVFPLATVVCLRGPLPSDDDSGRQAAPQAGLAAALPALEAVVEAWQQRTGLTSHATALVGFAEGATLALASTQHDGPPLAGRVVSLAGRFASLPQRAPADTTLHLIHGKHDPVVHYGEVVQAAERLVAIGADVTADIIPFLGHQVTAEVADLLVGRLTSHVPQRMWREAMRSAPD
jgi:phospholipase/carboxylesterase